MKTFREIILEVGKTPADIHFEKSSRHWIGHFTVKNQKFKIIIDILISHSSPKKFDIWQFKFFRDDETRMFNDSEFVYQVIPTIKKAIEDFVSEVKPDALLFAASDNSKARKALYKLQAGYLASKYGYHDLTNINVATDITFGIYKEEYQLDKMLKEIGIKRS